jgi:hypothetical protein
LIRRSWLLAAAVYGLLACRGTAPVEPKADVYVPPPQEAGVDAADGAAGGGDASVLPGQVDRAGHPFASVLLVPGSLQDTYNAQPSFETNVPRVLQDALESRLVFLDTLSLGDGGADPVDWPVPEGGTHPLLPVFVNDVLLVDTALPCTQSDGGFAASYLEIEREIYLAGASHVTCGGRTPSDNVVDTTWKLLVTGSRDGGASITQGAFGPTKPAMTKFPYLASPN